MVLVGQYDRAGVGRPNWLRLRAPDWYRRAPRRPSRPQRQRSPGGVKNTVSLGPGRPQGVCAAIGAEHRTIPPSIPHPAPRAPLPRGHAHRRLERRVHPRIIRLRPDGRMRRRADAEDVMAAQQLEGLRQPRENSGF
eukprot:scaffold96520_cov63-Phaeocystis_antarctica.AAC.1